LTTRVLFSLEVNPIVNGPYSRVGNGNEKKKKV